jgi:hypothetical protein
MTVLGGVMLAGFFSVMNGMHMMALGDMGVVTSFMMVPGFMMFGGREMMLRGMFVVLGSFAMMLRTVVF